MNISSTAWAKTPIVDSDWELIPRFHPDVYSYTVLSQLPASIDQNLLWKFTVANVYTIGIYKDTNKLQDVQTNIPSVGFPITIDGWNSIDAQFTENNDGSGIQQRYTFQMYRKSRNTSFVNQRMFLNPLVASQGAQLASNSNAIPDNFAYVYNDALASYADISNAAPALTSVPIQGGFLQGDDSIDLEDLQYTTNVLNSGLLILSEGNHALQTMRY